MAIKILPSLLSADFANLLPAIRAVEAGGADLLHLDVMDGRFVPNITIGPPVVAAVRKATSLPLDCHLMIVEPSRYLDAFVDAGANFISFHIEAEPHAHRALQQLKNRKTGAGMVLNPITPVTLLEPALEFADYFLVMSVNPGFGGQSFIPEVLRKVEWLAAERSRRGLKFAIEIDGGITTKTIAQCANAGCDWFVAGTAVFGQPDPGAAIAELRKAAGK
jgi:ribulose-phosphate 3-epimerase